MNSPLCQTTSQIRGVLTSFTLPSFGNIFLTPSGNQIRPKGGEVPAVLELCFSPAKVLSQPLLVGRANGLGTGHNTVNSFRLARRRSFNSVTQTPMGRGLRRAAHSFNLHCNLTNLALHQQVVLDFIKVDT